jgi:hypothetical protein
MEKEYRELIPNTLKWLPWIGNEYSTSSNKILIVGESHYSDSSEQSKNKHQNEKYTRDVINELAIKYITKDKRSGTLFRNLNLALIGWNSSNIENRLKLWNKVCFYNFVQEEMKSLKDRPSKQQLVNGWESFIELVRIIQPTQVFFIGSKVCDEFSESMNK